MQQVKLFKGVENGLGTLEAEVNEWIRDSSVRVIHISGNIAPQTIPPRSTGGGLTQSSFSPSDVILVILYETTTSA